MGIGEAGKTVPSRGHEPTPNPAWQRSGTTCMALGKVVCGHSVYPATLIVVPRMFFDACDGLFTNYNWKEEQLERTRQLAGPRQNDVYVGVDVFARGDVIGGGFDTDKVGVTGLGQSVTLDLPRHRALSSH